MNKQVTNLTGKILAKQIYLKIEQNKTFTFAVIKKLDDNLELVTLNGEHVSKEERANFKPLIDHYTAKSIDKQPLDYLFSENERTSFNRSFIKNYTLDSWFSINREIVKSVSPWTHQKLINFTSTLFEDCNPDKSISLSKLKHLETKITSYEKLLKFEQDRLNKHANNADFVKEYLDNLQNLSNPAIAPNTPLQSEISQEDDVM